MCFANLFFHVILCCFKLSGLTHIVLWRQRNSFPPVGFISGDPCLTPSVSLDMAPWQHSSSSLTSMRSDPHLCHWTPSLPPWPTTVSFATAATQLDIFQVAYLQWRLDSATVSIFVVILIKLTNTVFDNSTNITTNIETAVLSKWTPPILMYQRALPPSPERATTLERTTLAVGCFTLRWLEPPSNDRIQALTL